ncbi:MAG TPA: acylphosphatase [Candidatus Nitrosopolaris sp.]|nr:acylphosphatase [Candidatus Nitrosopolaris sp.]
MTSSPSSFTKSGHDIDNKKIRAHIFVLGKVQGVYFRQNTQIVATSHGVTGWVRNLKDGRVEVLLEGYEEDVGQVIEWCHAGPPKATVDNIDINYEKYTGEFVEFSVNY